MALLPPSQAPEDAFVEGTMRKAGSWLASALHCNSCAECGWMLAQTKCWPPWPYVLGPFTCPSS
eukprot:5881407-Lingulodinium_polyedra.AAC.1